MVVIPLKIMAMGSILFFSIAYFYYFKTFPYWKPGFLEIFTYRGLFTLISKSKKFPEPGETYARRFVFFYSFAIIYVFFCMAIALLPRLVVFVYDCLTLGC